MVMSINSDKVAAHHNPVPNAAIVHGVLVTSGILGKRLDTRLFHHEARWFLFSYDT